MRHRYENKEPEIRSLKYHKTDKSDLSAMNQYIVGLRDRLDSANDIGTPIVAHYSVNRVIPDVYPRLPKTISDPERLDAYKNASAAGHLFSDFFNWFRLSEDYENEKFKDDKEFQDYGLRAVRDAMQSVFPDYSELRVTRRPLALTMKKGRETFKINQLSDGEKSYISLVCDIARRLAIANPGSDALSGDGIVMIDEIDLHLHPKWQQSVISNLVNTFPNCQFFITTHSPIVASDVSGKVFAIKNGAVTEQQTYGKLSSNTLSSVFDLAMARNLYIQSMIDEAYDAIRDMDEVKYADCFGKLVNILGADDPDITGLKIEKIRRSKLAGK